MNKQNLIILVILVVGIMTRLIQEFPPNFGAVGAIALFGGAYFSNRLTGLLLPIAVLFGSDLLFGLTGLGTAYYSAQPYVYISFAMVVLIGLVLRNNATPLKIAGGSVAGSILFYIVSNMGVWLTTTMYSNSFNGFITCFVEAIPFFRNTLAGDLVFNAVFFGSAYLISQKFPKIMPAPFTKA